jgi:hypothetical protein
MDWLIRLDCGALRERRTKNTTSTTAIVNNENAMTYNASRAPSDAAILATGTFRATGGTGGGCWSLAVTLTGGA